MAARSESFLLRLTPKERQRMEENMRKAGMVNLSAYLRKMALAGRIIRIDLPELREIIRIQRICSNNLNQYAKKAHQTGRIYEEDMKDLQIRLEEIWQLLKKILETLANTT